MFDSYHQILKNKSSNAIVYFAQNGDAITVSLHKITETGEKKGSRIESSIRSKLLKWLWEVDLKSFEPIHGMSRIAKLIPDKLATAIAINNENLKDPKDDGSFLIDLVLKLLVFYQAQLQVIFLCHFAVKKVSGIEFLLK